MGKAASFNPSDFRSGGNIDNGRYTITAAQAIRMDTNRGEKAAVEIVLKGANGSQPQRYTAGSTDFLIPSDDGKRLIHPGGEDAQVSPRSNFSRFLKALVGAGFPLTELTESVDCFLNADIEMVDQALPKAEGEDEKHLSLPTKYYGRAGKTQAKARPTATAASTVAKTAPTSTSPSASNGDVDEQARDQVIAALAASPDGITRQRLGTVVMTAVAALRKSDPGVFANLTAIRKVVLDPAWLAAQAEAGGWKVEGDQVSLG